MSSSQATQEPHRFLLKRLLGLLQLLLQLQHRPVLELGRPVQVVVPLSALDLQVHPVDLVIDALQALHLLLLLIPQLGKLRLLLIELVQLRVQLPQPLLGCLVRGSRLQATGDSTTVQTCHPGEQQTWHALVSGQATVPNLCWPSRSR